jgi:uncharacterized protein YutE (UPF0331/DUF86 family)
MLVRVRRQFGLVESYFRDFLEFRRRGESIYAIERIAQLLIQSLLDLGAMLAIELNLRKPDTYRGIALMLSELLKLSGEDRDFLVGLAGFRNILVHGYAEINRDLEERAFREIEGRMGKVIEQLRTLIEGVNDMSISAEVISEKLRAVFERHGVRYAILFGSRARGGFGRDFDIAVSMRVESGLELGRLIVDIAEALGVHEDLVDLVHIESAGSGIMYTILNEGIVIYGDPEQAREELYKRYLEILDMESVGPSRVRSSEKH